MKKIILGLSTIFILAQNGFAVNNDKYMQECINFKVNYEKGIKGCQKEIDLLLSKDKLTFYEKFLLGKSYDLISLRYNQVKNKKLAFKYAMKAYNVDYCHTGSSCDIGVTIGYAYAFGLGIKQNKIKAYQFYLEAAKNGSQLAQKNLDVLCKESSWACK